MFGIITHQIGKCLDHEVFINDLPNSKLEVVTYSTNPVNKFEIKKAEGCTYKIIERNKKDSSFSDNTVYINAIELSHLSSGGLTITIDDHEVPEIKWSKKEGVVTALDFAGEPAYLSKNEWHKPENPKLTKHKELLNILREETDPMTREDIKAQIVDILSPTDPDFGRFILNLLLGEENPPTH